MYNIEQTHLVVVRYLFLSSHNLVLTPHMPTTINDRRRGVACAYKTRQGSILWGIRSHPAGLRQVSILGRES